LFDDLNELSIIMKKLYLFCGGARQTQNFAVRFAKAHGKQFFKKLNFSLLFISPLQKHYFVLNI
jgi:hypothetical protein